MSVREGFFVELYLCDWVINSVKFQLVMKCMFVVFLKDKCLFKHSSYPGFRVPDAGQNVMMCLIQEFRAIAELVGFKICGCVGFSVSQTR